MLPTNEADCDGVDFPKGEHHNLPFLQGLLRDAVRFQSGHLPNIVAYGFESFSDLGTIDVAPMVKKTNCTEWCVY